MELLKFRIQTLLSLKDGKVSGPMSPMLFAKEVSGPTGVKFNRLARLWFDNEAINQQKEDGGLTGFDTLIIGSAHEDDLLITLLVDIGDDGIPIAMAFQLDKEIITQEWYKNTTFVKSLSQSDIKQIFDSVFALSEQLNLKKELSMTRSNLYLTLSNGEKLVVVLDGSSGPEQGFILETLICSLFTCTNAEQERYLLALYCAFNDQRVNADYRYEIDMREKTVGFYGECYFHKTNVFRKGDNLNKRLTAYIDGHGDLQEFLNQLDIKIAKP